MKATFRGGVHPAHGSKAQTQGLATRSFVSDTVRIIMNMNIGAPSQPCVAKGDHVKIGQVIGEPVGFLGLPVHASVSGEVVSVEPIPYLSEQPAMCVTIHTDFADEWVELHPLGSVETVDPALIIPAIKNAGICGLGGAYISLVTCAGNWQQDCVSGQGWIAVALVIFVSWKPAKALWGAFFFGALRILKLYVPASVISLPSAFYLMLPFAVTCVVLVLSSIRMRRENQAPAACGVNYFREER